MLVAIRLWRQERTLVGTLMAFQDAGGSLGMLGKWTQGIGEGETLEIPRGRRGGPQGADRRRRREITASTISRARQGRLRWRKPGRTDFRPECGAGVQKGR